jgi:hypothetical protein
MAVSKPTVSASAEKKPAGDYGDLEDISIQPAKNGYIVTERRSSKQKKNEPYSFQEPERFAFSNAEETIVHVAKCLGLKKKE